MTGSVWRFMIDGIESRRIWNDGNCFRVGRVLNEKTELRRNTDSTRQRKSNQKRGSK